MTLPDKTKVQYILSKQTFPQLYGMFLSKFKKKANEHFKYT